MLHKWSILVLGFQMVAHDGCFLRKVSNLTWTFAKLEIDDAPVGRRDTSLGFFPENSKLVPFLGWMMNTKKTWFKICNLHAIHNLFWSCALFWHCEPIFILVKQNGKRQGDGCSQHCWDLSLQKPPKLFHWILGWFRGFIGIAQGIWHARAGMALKKRAEKTGVCAWWMTLHPTYSW